MTQHAVGEYVYNDGVDLGEGSYGKVFRGHRKQNENELVAIKAINLNKSTVRRAGSITTEREIEISEILTSTRHPNLVLFHCHEKIFQIIYLVMEFCNGGNLYEYLQAQELKTLTEKTIRGFFKQIGAGLKFLHENRIVHRDLKPENILLNFDGPKYPTYENIRLKIGDFGFGRCLAPDEKATTNCGTPYYQAPEVASKNYDKKVDLWSIGMMIYECVVGTVKTQESYSVITSSEESLRRAPATKTKLLIERLPVDVTQDLRELLSGLLKHDPKERFDCDRLMSHIFMLESMNVSIYVDKRTTPMQITKTSPVDELYEKVAKFPGVNGGADAIYLYVKVDSSRSTQLERGSGSSVEDAGIRNGSTIVLVHRASGGIYKTNQIRTSDELL